MPVWLKGEGARGMAACPQSWVSDCEPVGAAHAAMRALITIFFKRNVISPAASALAWQMSESEGAQASQEARPKVRRCEPGRRWLARL
jgi:hypothetical protein